MKRFLYLLMILLLLTGCNKKLEEKEDTPKDNDSQIDEPVIPKYVDNNPVVVGLYQNGKLVKDLTLAFNDWTDITSFDVYFTNEENVGSSNTKANFNKYYQNYEDNKKYKIGFYISFDTLDGKKEATITTPNVYQVSPYIYTYLYDDINQPDGAWYSHIEDDQVTDKTIYSSIKLFAAEKPKEITSPVSLSVFTYDDMEDFDDNGKYRGKSIYTVTITKKN